MGEVYSWDVAIERGVLDLREPFRAVHDQLIELLAGLERQQWAASTMLPGWDVHAIALHLLGGDLGRLAGAWFARPRSAELGFDELAATIEQGNEDWVRAARRIPPPLLVDLLRLTAERVSALYAEADLWAPATPVAWTGRGPSPLWLDLAREYTERWVHQAQIREAVGGPLLADRRWLWPVLDVFMLCLPRALEEIDAPSGTTVEILVSGPAGGSWHATRRADRWHVAGGQSSGPSATLSLRADVAWCWLAGLLPPSAVEECVSAEGDPRLWKPALRAVAVMTTGS